MADWSSLKPLRKQRTLLWFVNLLLVIVLCLPRDVLFSPMAMFLSIIGLVVLVCATLYIASRNNSNPYEKRTFSQMKNDSFSSLQSQTFSSLPTVENQVYGNLNAPIPKRIEEKPKVELVLSQEQIEHLIKEIAKNEIGIESYEFALLDPMFDDAARTIVNNQQGSTSLLQRKLNLGYNRANRIMEQLEDCGIVGIFEGSKSRRVLISNNQYLEQLLDALRLETTKFKTKYRYDIDLEKTNLENKKNKINQLSQREIDNLIERIVKKDLELEDYEAAFFDPMLRETAQLIVDNQQVSISFLQQELELDHNRVNRIIEQLEICGVVGSLENDKSRQVLIGGEQYWEQFLEKSILAVNIYWGVGDIATDFRDKYKNEIELVKNEFAEREKIKQDLLEKERKRQLRKQIQQELIEAGEISTPPQEQ